jgi:hypothetical protein
MAMRIRTMLAPANAMIGGKPYHGDAAESCTCGIERGNLPTTAYATYAGVLRRIS